MLRARFHVRPELLDGQIGQIGQEQVLDIALPTSPADLLLIAEAERLRVENRELASRLERALAEAQHMRHQLDDAGRPWWRRREPGRGEQAP